MAVTGSPSFVVFEGDSLTAGFIVGYVNRWPAQMLDMTGFEAVDGIIRAISNSMIGNTFNGNGLNIADPSRTAVVDSKYDPTRKHNGLVLLAGRNNLAEAAETGASVASDIFAYADARRAVGFSPILLCTIFDTAKQAGEGVASQAVLDSERANCNNALVAGWASHADAIVRLDLVLPDRTNTNLFQLDQVHNTTTGETVKANAVKAILLPFLA